MKKRPYTIDDVNPEVRKEIESWSDRSLSLRIKALENRINFLKKKPFRTDVEITFANACIRIFKEEIEVLKLFLNERQKLDRVA